MIVKARPALKDLFAIQALPFMTSLVWFLGQLAFLIALHQQFIILIIFIPVSPCLPGICHGTLLHDDHQNAKMLQLLHNLPIRSYYELSATLSVSKFI
jgi:hypothetical protein